MTTVQLFATCLIDSLFPEVGEAVIEVLQRAGARVAFPAGQTCCGQPAHNAGFANEARRMAQHTIEVFEDAEGPIILPSGSCAAMLKSGYRELFAEEPDWLARAERLAGRSYELSEYLVDVLRFSAANTPYPYRAAYHPSCHLLRGLLVDEQPLKLMRSLKWIDLTVLPPDCCGFGGLFAIDEAPISMAMLDRRLDQIERARAEVVVGCDVSCLMQIEGGLRRRGSSVRCAHLAQALCGREPGLR